MGYQTLLVVAVLCIVIQDVVFSEINYKTTYPLRLDSHRHKRDLSTAAKGGHEDTASYMLKSFDDKNIQIDVKRNKKLLSPSFTLRYFNPDGSEVISKDAVDHCHYQGSIRGQPGSTVVLNTCSGLRGIIDTQDETYHIEPHQDYQDTGAHKIYPATDSFDVNDCGHSHNAKRANTQDRHGDDKLKTKYSRFKRTLSAYNIDDFYRPFLTTDETRYNELLMVVDNGMYVKYNSDIKTVTDRVVTLANAVDAIYQRINVRIVLSVLEIWSSGDKIARNKTGIVDLATFREYRDKVLKPKYPHDNAQFLSHYYWSDAAGWGYVGGMCGYNSVGVNAWSFNSIIGPYVTVAHEMGHNFNFQHDVSGHYCKCLTPRGCIMGGHKTRVPGFSNCSMNSLKDIDDSCLYNVPTQAVNHRCGNGIREGDEQCDCGTPEMCAAKDPCCEPHGCKLKASSQCSDLHHTCCKSCVFKNHGTMCRASSNECDLPEYCTGVSGDCPGNSHVHDGRSCDQNSKVLHGNTNFYSVVTNRLSPKIVARYVRINPHYWNQSPCLRTELYGCPTDQVSSTAPTPLKAYTDYCLVPPSDNCSPADGSKPLFKSGYECKQNYMEFSLDANSILRHHCSGKKICPQNGGTASGTKLVMSSSCTDDNSKFVRTTGLSLKHVATGKCVHPNGGWPNNNVELVIWSGCDVERLQFWFMKQDCIIPLGMQSKAISDNQITASSHRNNKDPKYARLKGSGDWCAKEKKQTEYLQIDIGQVQKISSIATQGANGRSEWVTGYAIQYSVDGDQWKAYSGSSSTATQPNSYCYQGKCQKTHDKQCKDLWGVSGEKAVQGCYDKLNTEAQGYGTCNPSTNSSCAAADVLCGQIQCKSSVAKPAEVDYGYTYTTISLTSGDQCSAATLKKEDSLGQGMVKDGTKCGDQKMCKNNMCQSITVSCQLVNGQLCAGRGVCRSDGTCHCNSGYDPATACNTALTVVNGGFSAWSAWSNCSVGCNGGTQTRHRFCNNPVPLNGGQDCQGERTQSQDCNTDFCPIAKSCRDLQSLGQANNKPYPDGIYVIYPDPTSDTSVKTYCDMSRDGGGWTLLVASHTNSWTADNVKLRNANSPNLHDDYSILKYADVIKNNIEVEGLTFEYRLEAQNFGRWGGIWKADRVYSFTANNDKQTNVELVKKFDNWQPGNNAIEQRMPWLNGEQLSTSKSGSNNWGTITDNEVNYHPAPWIQGKLMEEQPAYIWYWMREGPSSIPSSCADIQLRGYGISPLNNGLYTIKPPGKDIVQTYCDMTTDGGGWTLIATSKTHTGWTSTNVKERNSVIASLDSDYSILGWADAIKNKDTSQEFFQYRIEADGASQYGGIFDAPRSYSFVATSNTQTNIKLVKNYNNTDVNSNLAKRMPRLGLSSDIFLSSGSSSSDTSGSIIYNGAGPQYLPGVKPTPGVVRYWMREGTRRSCNDIKLHGVRAGRSYQDGYYMIRIINQHQYLPVFCDMTSEPGAFTLIVTSRHNSWTRAQVPERNILTPSLNNDYSILKYADMIKNISNNETFQYKLDAHQRGHWGGVWKAPHDYSFMASNNKQTAVTEVKKFDDWTYGWYNSLNLRMPWYNVKEASTKALLTTSVDVDYYPSGSVIWGHSDRNPADWIWKNGMQNPGVIWYWLDEDDCDANRQPVHGGLTEWSSWSACDKLCLTGQQKRQRTCTNPKPRCGGNTCNEQTESKSCYTCPESPIKSYNGLCVQPSTSSCSGINGSHLIFKTGDSNCSQTYQNFIFDSNGVIHHRCSGLVVCPESGNPTYGKKLLLQETCDQSISRYQRLSYNVLKNLNNGFCVHANGGWPNDGVALVYWSSCDNVERIKLDFFNLPAP